MQDNSSDYIFKAYITNTAAYDSGERDNAGTWLYFPANAEEITAAFTEIGLPISATPDMYFFDDYVSDVPGLDNLREVIGYVSQYEDEFIRMVMDTDVRQRNKELTKQKKRMSEIQSRMKELDNLFQRIYEDNISGKLSDERFMKLSKGYDTEQADLQEEMTRLQEHIQQAEKQSVNVDRFLSIVKKYTNLTELTPEILHEFVDRIIVHAPDKSSGRRLQEIEIIYNHIGTFDHSKVTLWKGKAV